jgi:cell division initiation protein
MTWTSVELEQRRFRTRLLGLDPKEVERFCQQLNEESRRLKVENAGLRKDLQDQEKELHEYKEREKTIRTVLVNAHKTAEQVKANAEKEAKLIVAEAELEAEKLLQGAHQRLARIHDDIEELKRQRILLESKLRSTIETCQQWLNAEREDEGESEPQRKVKLIADGGLRISDG